MDPFEEFEFKPLTDGLGFHKKKASTAPSSDSLSELAEISPTTSRSTNLLKDKGLELLEEKPHDLRPPLPRKKSSPIPAAPDSLTEVGGDGSTSAAAVDEILKTLQKNRRLDAEKTKTKITSTPKVEEYAPTTWNVSASLLDGMLVVAAGLLCMIILLVITKVDLIGNLTHPDPQGLIYLSTFGLFASVAFIYLVINRIFLGATPGEWAFDQRIGKPAELNTTKYCVAVIARSALVVCTGLVIMPVASLLMNKDYAGLITGARLHKKV